jgi:hypothetical protein
MRHRSLDIFDLYSFSTSSGYISNSNTLFHSSFYPSRPFHKQLLRLQMQNIVHSIESNFMTCACGDKARNCAVRYMKAYVEGWEFPLLREQHQPTASTSRQASPSGTPVPTPGAGPSNLSSTPPPPNKHPASLSSLREIAQRHPLEVDLGPLVGAKRGLRTRVTGGVMTAGVRGVETVDEEGRPIGVPIPELIVTKPTPKRKGQVDLKGKGRAEPGDREGEGLKVNGRASSPSPTPTRPSEDVIPPRMRKKWIRQESETLRRMVGGEGQGPSAEPDGGGEAGGEKREQGMLSPLHMPMDVDSEGAGVHVRWADEVGSGGCGDGEKAAREGDALRSSHSRSRSPGVGVGVGVGVELTSTSGMFRAFFMVLRYGMLSAVEP